MQANLRRIYGFSLLAILAAVTIGSPAEAFPRGINHRQYRQQRRIDQGVQNGSLTTGEQTRIDRRESKLNNQEARMRASGGGLSRRERRRLQAEQTGLSHNIYRQKHDQQVQ